MAVRIISPEAFTRLVALVRAALDTEAGTDEERRSKAMAAARELRIAGVLDARGLALIDHAREVSQPSPPPPARDWRSGLDGPLGPERASRSNAPRRRRVVKTMDGSVHFVDVDVVETPNDSAERWDDVAFGRKPRGM